jgi:hypothetical protein
VRLVEFADVSLAGGGGGGQPHPGGGLAAVPAESRVPFPAGGGGGGGQPHGGGGARLVLVPLLPEVRFPPEGGGQGQPPDPVRLTDPFETVPFPIGGEAQWGPIPSAAPGARAPSPSTTAPLPTARATPITTIATNGATPRRLRICVPRTK